MAKRSSDEEGPIHDFQKTPAQLPEGSALDAIIKEALTPRMRALGISDDALVIISMRASYPRRVLGSQKLAACVLCGEQLWVSPSSIPMLDRSTFVCEDCVGASDPRLQALFSG